MKESTQKSSTIFKDLEYQLSQEILKVRTYEHGKEMTDESNI